MCDVRDSWQDPLAIGICIVGFIVAGALVYNDRRGSLDVAQSSSA